ncbi:MAG: ABC transporter permease [Thermoanaerobacteraceae bacterium]|nr:ABC transporter permease [Thermoanaerobacteraceae bacterium]
MKKDKLFLQNEKLKTYDYTIPSNSREISTRRILRCLDWIPIFLAMGIVWRRRWWRFLVGGINRPVIFLAIFAWNLKGGNTAIKGYLGYLIPGLVVMAAVSASYSDLVNWFTLRRTYYRVLDEYLLSPISNSSLLLGHVLGGAVKGFLIALIVYLSSNLFMNGLHLNPLIFLQLFIICLTFASLAVAVAMVAGGDKDVLMFTNLIVFPMTFFCGTFFPVDRLPGFLKIGSWFLPLTAATYNLRSLALNGLNNFSWFIQSLAWLFILYLSAFILLRLRRED